MNSFERACDEVEKDIISDGETNNENAIEWIKNSDIATVTFSQKRYVSKIEKLAERFPDKVKIIHKNSDGSILAHIPVKAIKLQIVERKLTEEQRLELKERITKARKAKKNKY